MGPVGHSISGAVDVSTQFSNTRYFFLASSNGGSSSVAYTAHLFSPTINQQPDQQTRHHRHSKIYQACHIPSTWIKTAPPQHVNPLAMPEHFNPAIFCLGVFTRNEERTTGYRPVSPVPGKKTNQ